MEEKKKLSKQELEKIRLEQEREQERASILMKADEVKEESLNLNFDGQVELKSELADLILEQMDDPNAKYELYYNVVNRLLRKHLPKGKEFEEARNLIYEEKNTFLTRGHRKDKDGRRGADGRMSYIADITELINIITHWISTHGTLFDLYCKVREINIAKGYGTAEE